jgi:hypothetical protein
MTNIVNFDVFLALRRCGREQRPTLIEPSRQPYRLEYRGQGVLYCTLGQAPLHTDRQNRDDHRANRGFANA